MGENLEYFGTVLLQSGTVERSRIWSVLQMTKINGFKLMGSLRIMSVLFFAAHQTNYNT